MYIHTLPIATRMTLEYIRIIITFTWSVDPGPSLGSDYGSPKCPWNSPRL